MRTPMILPALVLAVLPASADVLNFALTPALLSAPAGQATTLEFTGTLSNPTTGDVFLNGDVSALDQTLTLDDSPFFTFSPLFLPGGGTYTGPFFDVLVDPSILPGSYSGSFTIQGGADAMAFDNLATQDFTVHVAATAVPEPGFPIVLLVALLILTEYLLGRRLSQPAMHEHAFAPGVFRVALAPAPAVTGASTPESSSPLIGAGLAARGVVRWKCGKHSRR